VEHVAGVDDFDVAEATYRAAFANAGLSIDFGSTNHAATPIKGPSTSTPLGNVGALNADSTRLKQILLNLLSNACKFTKEGEVALLRKVADGRDWLVISTFEPF
jgi:signal transduction histidine kinase